MQINGEEYEVGIDLGNGESVAVEDRIMHPTAEYPEGSWLHKVGNEVRVATGYYATLYPDKPSFYWHKGPPFSLVDTTDWPW